AGVQHTFRNHAVIARPERTEAVAFANRVSHHEADIVAMARVFIAGIAQPGDQQWKLVHRKSEVRSLKPEIRNRKSEVSAIPTSGFRFLTSFLFFAPALALRRSSGSRCSGARSGSRRSAWRGSRSSARSGTRCGAR